MSEFARIGIVTTLFVVLLSIGSAVGISFYFKALPEPDRSPSSPMITHWSPNLARSDKTDSVFDIRQRLGQDERGRSSDKPVTTEPSSVPDPASPPHPTAKEPNFETPAATEVGPPGQPGSIAVWDNHFVQHYAVPDYHERRVLHRVALKGDRPV